MKKLIIETSKLYKNINIIKSITSSKIIAVLKGNGYGLGIFEFASFLLENGIDMFALSDMEDAIYLVEKGFTGKILLLTPINSSHEAELLIKNKFIPSIGSISSAKLINDKALELNEIVDFHLKIDTGFGRFGFLPDELHEFCSFFKTLKNIDIQGTYSHFSFSFSKNEKDVLAQYRKFIDAINIIEENGISPGLRHICNSSAFLKFTNLHLEAVRIGSAFLGRLPITNKYGLEKVGYLKSKVTQCKSLPKGHNIGYANTYKTSGITKIGIVPVGYLDGFGLEKSRDTFRPIDILRYVYNDLKTFNKKYHVYIENKSIPLLGRISTYNIIIDITGTDIKVGDEVILDVNTMLVPINIKREYI